MANSIEEIITTLYEMVQDAWSLPLGAEKCVLERDKVLDLLDEISNQLPCELKQAKTIVESRNEVITNAKREAETGKPAPIYTNFLMNDRPFTSSQEAYDSRYIGGIADAVKLQQKK